MAEQAWPEDWDERKAGKDCPICRQIGGGDNDHWVWVHTGAFTETYLERRSRLPGYCLVVWKHGHVAEPTELGSEAAAGFWRELLAVGRAVETRFDPVKLNYSILGNWVPHLHAHVLPRYHDDPAPGGPLPWGANRSADPIPEPTLHAQATDIRRLLGA